MREIDNVLPTALSNAAWTSPWRSKSGFLETCPMCAFVSLSVTMVMTVATALTIAAIINGMASPYPTVSAEIAGPNTNPNPNDAPMIANPFARSWGLVVSEMTAEATGILPAVMPSSARAKNSIHALRAVAIRKKEMAVPVIDMTKRGFLPYLSESLPMIGVDKNWPMEKIENSRPF